nr:hypothetical protein [uncultured Lachnoanaerobaculum sp.]
MFTFNNSLASAGKWKQNATGVLKFIFINGKILSDGGSKNE